MRRFATKKYRIECNEKQLQLLRSAVELQMRIRIGQGFAITDNISLVTDNLRYGNYNDEREKILDVILSSMVLEDDHTIKDSIANTRWIERDMWVSLENGLGIRSETVPLGDYGLMTVR